MASIRKEFSVSGAPDAVWAAFADVGAVHTRLAPGFVTDVQLEPGGRRVTFANGFVAFEAIVGVDPLRRRLAYSVQGSPRMTHHNASFEVHPEGSGSRIVWQADLLPDEAAATIGPMMDAGAAVMSRTLDR